MSGVNISIALVVILFSFAAVHGAFEFKQGLGSVSLKFGKADISNKAGLCDCDYHPGGCTISKAAPPGYACHCDYEGAWTCSGTMALCLDSDVDYCAHPDKSIQSCVLGGGDCGGYGDTCDCDYHPGGCAISKAPPHDTACKCSYKGFWTCGGSITGCRSFSNQYCKHPDMSIHTCMQGGGDCEGY